tara:strand:+ start:558 stop:959 length:402 start_codon:yes stop_codon:yes gene_type:complete
MATRADFIIDQGSSFSTTITPSNSDGSILDLILSYTARGKIRKAYGASNSVDFTASVQQVDSPEQDTVKISLTSTQTAAMQAGRYVYDVEIINSNSTPADIIRILEGQIEITPSVTQNFGNEGLGIGVDSPSE